MSCRRTNCVVYVTVARVFAIGNSAVAVNIDVGLSALRAQHDAKPDQRRETPNGFHCRTDLAQPSMDHAAHRPIPLLERLLARDDAYILGGTIVRVG